MSNNTKCYHKLFVNITCPNITETFTEECRGGSKIILLNATMYNETYKNLSECPSGGDGMNKTTWTECWVDPEIGNATRCKFNMITNNSFCYNVTELNSTYCFFRYEKNITICNRDKSYLEVNNTIALLNGFTTADRYNPGNLYSF